MKWQGRERSSNIEDRRSQGGGGLGGNMGGLGGGRIPIPMGRAGGGGLGIVGIIVVLGVLWFMGINPLDAILGTGGGTTTSQTQQWSPPPSSASQDDLANFVGVVVKDTENLWGDVFRQNNMTYQPPKVVLFTDATQSACGVAQSASGPFYCPNDKKVYIDLSFYDQLRQQFGAPGDFAQAYVIAHEIGHAVQDQTGVLPEFNRQRASMSQEQQNAYSVRVELQADCYAGVWANYVNRENLLEQGDTEEAITAANAIGDDTLTRGQVSSRNFTHGTSAQRMAWLKKGMQTGDVSQCDTFKGAI
ncbi:MULTISPECIES: neutral zinc metallopeptidase [unclassified Devosia]|uniref:KPN_02809 family neutral zinc metallopeptidase n=1 Tax=unclassified Devosia TaxID=196773 RepID=UPI00086F1DE3|nr:MULTISPECIES: neutral zinc metallopeptidase [unclassified Devosia]MBN9363907.1 neutral zinc metallopeptidase [Devosia sp.]ODS94722.1 MAG: flagellar biosynthesis protein FlgM [Devosia sp. SCN 66-27]OJX27180.1 MAG: flagellar biosynthesis protein FlgM [Devosia sp. 66-14]